MARTRAGTIVGVVALSALAVAFVVGIAAPAAVLHDGSGQACLLRPTSPPDSTNLIDSDARLAPAILWCTFQTPSGPVTETIRLNPAGDIAAMVLVVIAAAAAILWLMLRRSRNALKTDKS